MCLLIQLYYQFDVFIDSVDINNDGKKDIIISPAEPKGQYYRISWCEAPQDQDGDWIEHIIESRIESIIHSVRPGDFNNDGFVDRIICIKDPQ